MKSCGVEWMGVVFCLHLCVVHEAVAAADELLLLLLLQEDISSHDVMQRGFRLCWVKFVL